MGIQWSCTGGLWDSLAVGRNTGKVTKANYLQLSCRREGARRRASSFSWNSVKFCWKTSTKKYCKKSTSPMVLPILGRGRSDNNSHTWHTDSISTKTADKEDQRLLYHQKCEIPQYCHVTILGDIDWMQLFFVSIWWLRSMIERTRVVNTTQIWALRSPRFWRISWILLRSFPKGRGRRRTFGCVLRMRTIKLSVKGRVKSFLIWMWALRKRRT